MRPKILYRSSLFEEELEGARKWFPCVSLFENCEKEDYVLPRYSILPYAEDFYKELDAKGIKHVSSYRQHKWIADVEKWLPYLEDVSPKCWREDELSKLPEKGRYVLKGQTNSRKDRWATHMFANGRREAIEVFCRLTDDSLINTQKVVIREYVPLRTFMVGLNEVPITNEYRFFVFGGEIVSWGYYWQNYYDDLPIEAKTVIGEVESYLPLEWLQEIIGRLAFLEWFVIDIAQKEDGGWVVIELNDAGMSGLGCIDPKVFYRELCQTVSKYLV